MSREDLEPNRFFASLGALAVGLAFVATTHAQPKPAPPPPAGTPTTPPAKGDQPQPPPPPPPPPQPQPSPSDAPPDAAKPGSAEDTAAPSEPAARRAAKAPAPPEEEEPEPPLIPPAQDSLAGHFTLSPGAALVLPFGSLASDVSQRDFLGTGLGLSVEAAIGLSRTVALGVWGQAASFGSGNECPDCSASSLAGGAFVRYHLVQGVRFDPWMSAGIGYRVTTIDNTPQGNQEYSGFEWLRLAVGGDWYAFSLLGFGPFLELDMGIYGNRPDGANDAALHLQLLVGARITLDVPGK